METARTSRLGTPANCGRVPWTEEVAVELARELLSDTERAVSRITALERALYAADRSHPLLVELISRSSPVALSSTRGCHSLLDSGLRKASHYEAGLSDDDDAPVVATPVVPDSADAAATPSVLQNGAGGIGGAGEVVNGVASAVLKDPPKTPRKRTRRSILAGGQPGSGSTVWRRGTDTTFDRQVASAYDPRKRARSVSLGAVDMQELEYLKSVMGDSRKGLGLFAPKKPPTPHHPVIVERSVFRGYVHALALSLVDKKFRNELVYPGTRTKGRSKAVTQAEEAVRAVDKAVAQHISGAGVDTALLIRLASRPKLTVLARDSVPHFPGVMDLDSLRRATRTCVICSKMVRVAQTSYTLFRLDGAEAHSSFVEGTWPLSIKEAGGVVRAVEEPSSGSFDVANFRDLRFVWTCASPCALTLERIHELIWFRFVMTEELVQRVDSIMAETDVGYSESEFICDLILGSEEVEDAGELYLKYGLYWKLSNMFNTLCRALGPIESKDAEGNKSS